jgi:hypothetical protein
MPSRLSKGGCHIMNFSEALTAMRMGSKVSREIWRGKVSHWQLIPAVDSMPPMIMASYPTGLDEIVHSFLTEDVLAEDWWVVT